MGSHLSREDYTLKEYTKAQDIPFVLDGNDPILSSSGTVMRVRGISGAYIAVKAARKTIKFSATDNGELQKIKEIMKKDASILTRARHPHMLKIIAMYCFDKTDSVHFSIVTDFVERSLQGYLTSKTTLHERWFGCLIGAVAYIHKHGIRHNNIKPDNILIKNETVLLTNFELLNKDVCKTPQTTAPKWARWKNTTYSAPEVEQGAACGRSADIFSLGAVFLEMLLARSYPDKFAELPSKLQLGIGRSYSHNVDTIRNWLASMPVPEQRWGVLVLSFCQTMLDPERDARPRAEQLSSEWKSVSSDSPLQCPLCDTASLMDGTDATASRAIHYASAAGKVDVLGNLLGSGIDVNAEDYGRETALYYAAGNGQEEVVVTLLEQKAALNKKNDEGWAALHYAAARGHRTIVKLLLDAGADPNLQDDEGWTPLHFAARNGYEEVVKLLLENGADVEAANNMKQTALHLAAKTENLAVIEILTANNSDVNERDNEERTALHLAAKNGHKAVTEMLIKKHANISANDIWGQTALHFAAEGGHKEVVKILLENNADVNIKNVKGQSALYFAALRGHREVFRMLADHTDIDIKSLVS